MTYCVALCVDEGLVFLADTRTNAGVDNVSAARKMAVFEQPGDRVLTLLCAGNLALTQAVMLRLTESEPVPAAHPGEMAGRAATGAGAANAAGPVAGASGAVDGIGAIVHTGAGAGTAVTQPSGYTLWNAPNMVEAARVVGQAVRDVYKRDAKALADFNVEFNCSFILGGQIGAHKPRLFMVYAAGNFVESTAACPYFQIGESKYGKPIIDRVVQPGTSLDETVKCALISMDSTLRSNLSVGLPLDLLVYERDALRVTRFAVLDQDNAYFQMIHRSWGERLRQVFAEIPNPAWTDASNVPLLERLDGGIAQGVRPHDHQQLGHSTMSPGLGDASDEPAAPTQTLAQAGKDEQPR